MKVIFLYFILLLYVLPASYAQVPKLILKISPLALIDDPSFPAIQAGVEWTLSKRWGWYNEAGINYRRSIFELVDSNTVVSRGWKAKSEIRYYLERLHGRGKVKRQFYLGLNLFLINDIHNSKIRYNDRVSGGLLVDNFGVRRFVKGGNLLFGWQRTISRRFYFDSYLGFGGKLITYKTYGKEFDRRLHYREERPGAFIEGVRDQNDSDARNHTGGNGTVGIRIGYRL